MGRRVHIVLHPAVPAAMGSVKTTYIPDFNYSS